MELDGARNYGDQRGCCIDSVSTLSQRDCGSKEFRRIPDPLAFSGYIRSVSMRFNKRLFSKEYLDEYSLVDYYVDIASFLVWLWQESSVSYFRLVTLSYSSLFPVLCVHILA